MDMGWLQGTPDKAQAQMLPKSLRLWGQGKPMAGLHPPNGAESLWEPLLGSKVFWGEGAAGTASWAGWQGSVVGLLQAMGDHLCGSPDIQALDC